MFKKTNAGDQLLIAVKLSKVSEISRLVALGVNVDSRIDKSGKTALHYAAYKGQLSAVKALAEAGADLDVTDENGVTPLQRAVVDGHSDVVKSLLKAGASFDKTDETGNTALHEAAWNGYSKCVELLVAAKCNVNIHNQTGYTCLHLAAQNGHCKTLQVLLHAGANPLAKNNYGDTPLHIAVRYGHVKACDTLFETKINTSEQNNDGSTPLHIAAGMGHEKLVEMLLRAGSLIGVRNNVGDTARDLAVQDGFRKIAQLLTPVKGDTLKLSKKEKKEKRRPHSVDVSHLYSETTVSTPTTLGTQLWIPVPADTELSVSKKSWHKRDVSEDVSWTSKNEQGERQKTAAKPKQLIIKYDEMCSIEREYSRFLKKRNETSRRRLFRKSRSKSSLKSEEKRMCSDPVLHMTPKKSSLRIQKGKLNGAQSRDDLEVDMQQKKNKSKKEKGFLGLFRSASDPDIHTSSKKNSFFSKKHRREKLSPSGKALENGLSLIKEDEEVKEKGEIEETKERKAKGKSERKKREKADEITGAKVVADTANKKITSDDLNKVDRKERKKGKEKKHSTRNDKEGSDSNCSLCEEKTRKQKEKTYSKESKHKEHRPKSEKKHSRDKHDGDKADLKEEDRKPHSRKDKTEDDREHRKKKHHRDKGKAKDKTDKDKRVNKATEKQLKVTELQQVNSVPGPCNQAQCSMCQASLSRLEAWQERCTSEIDSARRKLEHRLQRLEKKLEEQQSDESLLKDKETREKEYDRVVGCVTDQCQEVSKSVKETSIDVKGEIRKLIKDGLGRLEFRLNQVAAGYNMGIHSMDGEDRCNPELGRNCAVDRRILRPRSRSSPHLGRTPCDDCSRVSDPRRKLSPPPSPAVGNPSTVNSRVPVNQSDAMDRLVESGSQEQGHKLDGTIAATRVRDQRHAQEVDRWWREKADEEQRVLYARICELEQMLMMSRSGGAYFV